MKNRFRIKWNAPIVLGMTAICFVDTVLNYLTEGLTNRVLFSTYRSPFSSPLNYVRFLTHIFGHGDFAHFAGNMGYLLILGPLLEEKYSSVTLAKVIGIVAVVTALVNCIFFPNVMLCGASGVVFAFILLSSFTGFQNGEIPVTFLLVAFFFLGQQIVDGIFVQDNISNTAHILGGIVGAAAGYGLNKK